VVSVALLFALGRRLYGQRTAWLAAGLLALSPLAILFSITLFIDPLLTASVLWALWAASRARWRSLAAALATGFAIKQTALLFAPLALGLALAGLPGVATPRQAARRLWWASRPLIMALLISAGLVFGWDAARHAGIGFWTQGYADNMPGRLVRANEVLPRAQAWIGLLHYVTASTPLNLLLAAGLPMALIAEIWRKAARRAALIDVLLSGFALLYLAAYWLLAFNVWDRYLLPLAPLLALLLARVLLIAAATIVRIVPGRPAWLRPAAHLGLAGALALAAWGPARAAADSAYPVGGDHGAYDGIDEAATYVRGMPAGSVLYDHWLSWQWDFYLFGSPVYVAWFPSPQGLTTDLKAFGRRSPRFLVVPSWEGDAELRAAAAEAGFTFVERHTTYRRDGTASFHVYALEPIGHEGSGPN
jgi:4-amino-4-deoxy-L-arabinose transferase-like glycosyltransferase